MNNLATYKGKRSVSWFGIAMLFIIVAGNVLSHTAYFAEEEQIYDSDRQPPNNQVLQKLFFKADLKEEIFQDNDGLESLFSSNANETVEPISVEERRMRLSQNPPLTANIGSTYTYRFDVVGNQGPIQFKLQEHPEGMTIDAETGNVLWLPADGQDASHQVVLEAIDAERNGFRINYTLKTSRSFHLLGTDKLGRDIAKSIVLGARWALFPGLIAASIALVLGTLLGGVGAYYQGRTGRAIEVIVGAVETFPALILLFIAALIFKYNLYLIMVILGIVLFPGIAREVGSNVSTLAANQFIEAAHELGLSNSRILWIDIVWHNVRTFLISKFFVILGIAVAIEVTLSYLKLGVQYPGISWGTMIFEGRDMLADGKYILFLFPSIATILTVFGYYSLSRSASEIINLSRKRG